MSRYRRRAAPEWVKALMNELTRPPYFLEHLYKQQQQETTPKEHPPADEPADANASSSSSRSWQPNARRQWSRPSGSSSSSSSDNPRPTTQAGRRSVSSSPPFPPHAAPRPAQHAATQPRTEFTRPAEVVQSSLPSERVAAPRKRPWSAVFRQCGYPVALARSYGWKVTSAEPVQNVVKVVTKQGKYALKRTHIPPERVEFLYRLTKYMRGQGYRRAPRFVLTPQKRPSVSREENTYYATEWVAGNPVNFAATPQLGALAGALAEYHELSRGFEWQRYNPQPEFDLGDMIRRRTMDLRNLLTRAETKQNPDEFDLLLTRMAPSLREDAEKSLRIADDTMCQKFLEEDEENPGLCHLDVIPDNFIYSRDKEIYLLDLDLSAFAPRVLDLSHLLRRSLQMVNWQADAAYTCFVHYDTVRPMTAEEYLWVQCLLTFPYRAWRLVHTRYHLFRDKRQLDELQDVSSQEPRRHAFLDEYAKQIMREID